MKQGIEEYTESRDYNEEYEGDCIDHYQVHIFSMDGINSTYYNPKEFTSGEVKQIAETLLSLIRSKSDRKDRITLFEKNEKFLISEDKNFIDSGETLVYNSRFTRFQHSDEEFFLHDFFDHIGDKTAENFLRDALNSVGANDLFPELQPFVLKLDEQHREWKKGNEELRALNQSNPFFILEIYLIDKKYIAVKKQEILCHNETSALYLPEYTYAFQQPRYTHIIREISTNKIIEGDLNEAIQSQKSIDDIERNPPSMDLDDLRRMELDNDDPDFLDWDDYRDNDEKDEDDEKHEDDEK